MSLKAFHIVFIVCATALAAGIGVTGIRAGHVPAGVAALAAGAALLVYGVLFLRKMKHVGYL